MACGIYRSYLLRLWKPANGEDARIAVEEVETGESHAFADVERFYRWLDRETDTTKESATQVMAPSDGD